MKRRNVLKLLSAVPFLALLRSSEAGPNIPSDSTALIQREDDVFDLETLKRVRKEITAMPIRPPYRFEVHRNHLAELEKRGHDWKQYCRDHQIEIFVRP